MANAALDKVTKPFAIAQAATDTLQGGWNLFKDVTGLDYDRQVNATKEIQAQGQEFTQANMAQQFAYNKDYMNLQQFNQKELAKIAQDYNLTNMQKQFLYNSYLSSKARDVTAMRNMGLNPGSLGSNPSGSVSALGSSPGIAAIAGGSAPGSPAAPSIPGSRFATAGLAQDLYLKNSQAKKLNAEAERQETANLFALERELTDLLLTKAKIKDTLSHQKNLDADTQYLLDTLDEREENLRQEINLKKAKAKEAEQIGNAAEKNAQTAEDALTETQRHNQAWEKIFRVFANNGARAVTIEEKKLPHVISEIDARAQLDKSKKNLNDQDIVWYADKIVAQIELTEAQKQEAIEKSKKYGKEAKYYELEMAVRLGKEIVDAITDILPSKAVNRISSAVAGKVRDKFKVEEHGMTPQGRKKITTQEHVEYYE